MLNGDIEFFSKTLRLMPTKEIANLALKNPLQNGINVGNLSVCLSSQI